MSLPVFSNEAFYNFLRSKPHDETFDYLDHGNCAISQYLKSLGYTNINVTSHTMQFIDAAGRTVHQFLPEGWDDAVRDASCYTGTFGVAAGYMKARL